MDKKFHNLYPEIWGGIECTINRIGHIYLDQLEYAGHYIRKNDIESIAALGIKALRYPVLWELHQPNVNVNIDWTWAETQLNKIKACSIIPIVGLVHHGSGPRYTNLLDENFADRLAAYAEKVAEKFPWVTHYTPVNEPLTTARFSGLYGIWYPHKKDDLHFIRILLNELKAIVLSMENIHKINPEAKLIQTEDLGKTYSTPILKYQADFENERRWLTYDILFGKVNKEHPLWNHFIRLGIFQKSLEFFLEHPCPPAVLGFNHYITSERYIDDGINNYPIHIHGGNGIHKYADVEAIRVDHGQPAGLKLLLTEAWERFRWPMALTEVHLHCTREDQMRWFKEAWDICVELKQNGIDIRAVTAWSLLGAFGWNKLLTYSNGDYESGVFDLRSTKPRPTALAKLIQSLNAGKNYTHSLLHQKGWWHGEHRFLGGSVQKVNSNSVRTVIVKELKPILIVGKRGTLGIAFSKICDQRTINYKLLGRDEMDISKKDEIESKINDIKPWAIINAAGYVRVDDAETEIEKCFKENTKGAENLANVCNKHGIKLMTFSSDLVFNGQKNTPYVESDKVSPLNIYGKSKAFAERIVSNTNNNALIIRTSSFFGPWDKYNFAQNVLYTLSKKHTFICAENVLVSPTYVPDLVQSSLDLLVDDEKGIWHLTNQGEISWMDFAIEIAQHAGLNKEHINGRPLHEMQWKAQRPQYSVLHSEKGIFMPALEDALNRFTCEKEMLFM